MSVGAGGRGSGALKGTGVGGIGGRFCVTLRDSSTHNARKWKERSRTREMRKCGANVPNAALTGIGTAFPHPVFSSLPFHSFPSISFAAFSASGRRRKATKPPSFRPPGPREREAEGPSRRGYMICSYFASARLSNPYNEPSLTQRERQLRRKGTRLGKGKRARRTFTLPTGPNCANNCPNIFSVVVIGNPPTWTLVVSGS